MKVEMIASLGGFAWRNLPGPLAERLTEALGKVDEAERLLGETQAALAAAAAGADTGAPERTGSLSEEGARVRQFRARSVAARCMCYAAHNDVHMVLMAENLQRYGEAFQLDVEEAWEDLAEEAKREARWT